MTFYRPSPDFIDLASLISPMPGERIVAWHEILQAVAPIYNAANLPEDFTQEQAHEIFTNALRKLIDGGTFTPRAHPSNGALCLVS